MKILLIVLPLHASQLMMQGLLTLYLLVAMDSLWFLDRVTLCTKSLPLGLLSRTTPGTRKESVYPSFPRKKKPKC